LENNAGGENKSVSVSKFIGLFIILIIALIGIVIVSYLNDHSDQVQPMKVGLGYDPLSYCASVLLENSSSDYVISLVKSSDDLVQELNDQTFDAVLLPMNDLSGLDMKAYMIVAVTSSLNLVVIENGNSVLSINNLDGRTVILPDSLKYTPELLMFNALLSHAGVSINIVFVSNSALQNLMSSGSLNIIILPIDQCANTLLQNRNYHNCFNLAEQWKIVFGTQPPAGSCIVVRKAIENNKSANIASFLANFKSSMAFTNSKHEKAAELIIKSNLGTDMAFVRKIIPYCMFEYQEGDVMSKALEQWSSIVGNLSSNLASNPKES
jgi:hypothetical protein